MAASGDSDAQVHRASTTAPVNIAVIKYWGKRDPKLNLPTNSSLSVTLSQHSLRAHTTASCSSIYTADSLTLNNQPQTLDTPRSQACLAALRSYRADLEFTDSSLPKLSQMKLKINSSNNFPTAAGLASSAAGFAALVRAIADLYQLPQSPSELSLVARQGSGSACRSLMGGYVGWNAGDKDDGSDSKAYQVAPVSHWPEMRALILVASAAKKDVPSTAGMQATVATSTLFQSRARDAVPKRMGEMTEAIKQKDFERFAKVTMMDSNSFHACCADTYPPIFYMNDVSRAVVRFVEVLNEKAGRTVCAYTYDAGPNAVIYYEEANAGFVESKFMGILGELDSWADSKAPYDWEKVADEKITNILREGITKVIMTRVGEGPISVQDHLIDEQGELVR